MNTFCLEAEEIKEKAKSIRASIVKMNSNAGQGHTGGDLSEVDILATLYFRILNIQKNRMEDPNRDRYIQSKGHGVGGLYCTLAEAGFIDKSLLSTYLQFDSKLPGHPVRQKIPGIEVNTGALGHGLPIGVGLALSAKMNKKNFRVFVLTGDGELAEGSNWEAAMVASHYQLDNLIVINDRNQLQLADRTETIMALDPLDEKWRAFGFDVQITDGHDVEGLIKTIEKIDLQSGKPHVIIANTIKGKGVSFIEDSAKWHHRVPVGEELIAALEEIGAK